MGRRTTIFLTLLLWALTAAPHAAAQIRRGPRTLVRQGVMERPDTLVRDSLGNLPLPPPDSAARQQFARLDSLARALAIADSTVVLSTDSLRTLLLNPDSTAYAALRDSFAPADTLAQARLDSLRTELQAAARSLLAYETENALRIDSARLDSLKAIPPLVTADTTRHKKGWFMSDSMSLSKVCWISAVLPGYGQVYNKQYWKLPILYGTLGTGLGLFIHENKTYRPLKRAYDELIDRGGNRSPALEYIQTKMIRSNTRRQLYLGTAIASYLYFIGDAAVNYSTNDVSDVKKATTLACICPGAGQIYNKSYWKVPFVVGGFATMVYCIDWNNRGFQRFKKAYARRVAYEADPDSFKGDLSGDMNIPSKTLKSYKDSYRRNRDLCIIITAGLYILQIVDAHVDAHLKDYDISDDLSMNLEPMFDYTFVPAQGGHRPIFGFNMSINF